ncbi:MAG: hypothetical protein AB7E81_03370 [Hyphomicrobiaceae bacterium]
MSQHVMILTCGALLITAFIAGWSVGGFLSSSDPVERTIDYLLMGASLFLMVALCQFVAWEPLP